VRNGRAGLNVFVRLDRTYRAHLAGHLLVVDKDARLPDVCVKCGAVARLTRRRQRFQYMPPWALLFLAPTVLAAYPGTVLATLAMLGPLVGMLLMLATTRKAQLDLALCATCKRRWTLAVAAMALAAMAPFVGLLAVIASVLRSLHEASATPLLAGLGAVGLSLLVPIFVYFTFVGPRLLGVKLIDSTTITLARVHSKAAELIVRGAAPLSVKAASPR
jgi:hypothetical protein